MVYSGFLHIMVYYTPLVHLLICVQLPVEAEKELFDFYIALPPYKVIASAIHNNSLTDCR